MEAMLILGDEAFRDVEEVGLGVVAVDGALVLPQGVNVEVGPVLGIDGIGVDEVAGAAAHQSGRRSGETDSAGGASRRRGRGCTGPAVERT